MRGIMVVATVLVAIWSGYWFVGSYAMQRAAVDWFARQTAQGYVAQAASVVVRGYPSRFDLTAEDVTLADPASGLGWKAPFAQILSLSYKPWHVIAALPNSQTFTMPGTSTLPGQDITLLSAKLQASVRVTPNASLTLDRVVVAGTDLSATSTLGWGLRAAEVHLASQREAGDAAVYRLGLDVKGLTPDPALNLALPASIDVMRLDATATFSAPLDRMAQETRPTLTRLDVKEALIKWGRLTAFASGTVSGDANGVAAGTLDLRVENWRDLVPVLVATGMIAPGFELSMTAVLANLAKDDLVLTLPLTFANGYLSLGPIPLGPAPRMGAQP